MTGIKLPPNRHRSYRIVDPVEYVKGNVKKILTGIAIGAAVYGIATIPNSIKLNNELDSLSKEFNETALTAKYSTALGLDFNGTLDEIIGRRNDYLKYNHAINFGEWNAEAVATGKIRTNIDKNAWCWDPVKRIVSYKDWSDRKSS